MSLRNKDEFVDSLMWNMLMVVLRLSWFDIKTNFGLNVYSCSNITYSPYLIKEKNMVLQTTKLYGTMSYSMRLTNS